jgi:hypothetical protein
MMEQLPLWMQYVIMFVLGALMCALIIAIKVRYDEWNINRLCKKQHAEGVDMSISRLRRQVSTLMDIHEKEIKRYEIRQEKEQCH